MSLNIDAIHTKLVRIANSAVGSQLSAATGAVIKARKNKNPPLFPYISVDFMTVGDESGALTFSWVNDDDNPEFVTHKQIRFVYRCLGENAFTILNTLHGYFNLSWIRDDLRSTLKVGVVQLSECRQMPNKIGDKEYVETAEFQIVLNAPDVLVVTEEENSQLIEGVDITGELYRHEEDPDPLPVDIEIPPEEESP